MDSYLREIALADYDSGHPFAPDDYRKFEKLLSEDNIVATHDMFNRYFEIFDEIRSDANENRNY